MDSHDEKGHFIHSRSGRKVYERNCKQCQTTFFPARTDQSYCCESCRVMAYRRRVAKNQVASHKDTQEVAIQANPIRKLGELGSFTGTEAGDLALGVVAGNVLTNVGKSLLGVKSTEQKTLERIEQKLDQLEQKPAKPKLEVLFTGRSLYSLLRKGEVVTYVEVLLNQKPHYIDNAGRLFLKDNSGLRLITTKGREVLGLSK